MERAFRKANLEFDRRLSQLRTGHDQQTAAADQSPSPSSMLPCDALDASVAIARQGVVNAQAKAREKAQNCDMKQGQILGMECTRRAAPGKLMKATERTAVKLQGARGGKGNASNDHAAQVRHPLGVGSPSNSGLSVEQAHDRFSPRNEESRGFNFQPIPSDEGRETGQPSDRPGAVVDTALPRAGARRASHSTPTTAAEYVKGGQLSTSGDFGDISKRSCSNDAELLSSADVGRLLRQNSRLGRSGWRKILSNAAADPAANDDVGHKLGMSPALEHSMNRQTFAKAIDKV
jgi:hypothetical protein